MFHNVLMTTLTPLRNTNELTSWENRPFTTIWPEEKKSKDPPITKTIKKKPKRNRTAFTTEQLRALEKTYNSFRYIDAERRNQLAGSLNISEKSIKVWFQNRRMKEKRESSESSSDSSSEVTTSESPRPSAPSPQDVPTMAPSKPPVIKLEQHNQMHNQCQSDINNYELAHYQLPGSHHWHQPQYQNVDAHASTNHTFHTDRNVYSTNYYPNVDYYYGGYQYANSYTNEAQWTANNFDLNYFQ